MKKVLMPLIMVFVIGVANAQTVTTPKSTHSKAAEDLLVVMGLEKMTDDVMTQMLDMQIKSNPMLEGKKSVMQAFFKKYMSWSALKDDYVKIYQSEFTENEIKDMIAFYRTPTGKKLADKSGVLAMKGSQMGQQKVQEHITELQQMLMKD